MSYELKEKGNLLFREGDYNGAEELYSLALVTRSLARKKKKKKKPRGLTSNNNNNTESKRTRANQPFSPTAPSPACAWKSTSPPNKTPRPPSRCTAQTTPPG